jgi:hypothetical protein
MGKCLTNRMFASSTLLLFGFDAKVPADWHARVETVLGNQDSEMPGGRIRSEIIKGHKIRFTKQSALWDCLIIRTWYPFNSPSNSDNPGPGTVANQGLVQAHRVEIYSRRGIKSRKNKVLVSRLYFRGGANPISFNAIEIKSNIHGNLFEKFGVTFPLFLSSPII